MTLASADLNELRDYCPVTMPGDPGYEDACQAWNLAVRQRPCAVAYPESADDVAGLARAAHDMGLRVAPRSTGHAAACMEDVDFDDVVLVRMDRLVGVDIDPLARTARVLGGTRWNDLLAAAAPHGLTALHGSAGGVSIAGYALGGGLSFYGRQHGLAHMSVRAVDLVTASGERLRADADENPDLLWALRGGGGNFGTVVALEIDLLPIADVVAGMMVWDLARSPEVLRAWKEWTAAVPETVTTALRLMRFPPLPELPPFLSGQSLVIIDGAVNEDDARAAEILEPLRSLAPEMDTFERIPAAQLVAVHMDPPDPVPAISNHEMIATLPDEALSSLLAVAGPGVDTPLMCAELRQLGGALARPHDAALRGLHGEYALFAYSMVPAPELAAVVEAAVCGVVDAMRPWTTGGRYTNFADRPTDATTMFHAEDMERLISVRKHFDPRRRVVAAHAVGGR